MVGKRIKEWRIKRGLSISRLAQEAGVSKSYLSRIEKEEKNPSISYVKKIAAVLDVDVEDLILEGSNHISDEAEIDEEWVTLIQEAVHDGLTKEQFLAFLKVVEVSRGGRREA